MVSSNGRNSAVQKVLREMNSKHTFTSIKSSLENVDGSFDSFLLILLIPFEINVML